MEKKQIAIVLGATGLVGRQLAQLLLEDQYFTKVLLLVRRSTGFQHPKLEEIMVDFNDISSFQSLIKGDVLFSCMGTTLKKAGSKEAQYKVDYTYQLEVAEAAKENGVPNYILVSSSGANSSSMIFYSRIKGELENSIKALSFSRSIIFRPSLLLGERDEKRKGEETMANMLPIIIKLIPLLRKYRGIKGIEVAQAMINAYKDKSSKSIEIFELDEIFKLIPKKII